MKRLFLAVKVLPSDNFLDIFSSIKNELKHEKIKWVEEHNFHLTLRFFGETCVNDIESICQSVSNAVSSTKKFCFEIDRIGIFGSAYQPKVIWAGIPQAQKIIELEKSISYELDKIGFEKDRQNFVPHLTLGRIKNLSDKNLFQSIIDDFKNEYFQEQYVDKIYLFESILNKNGPEYKIVKSFQLE